MYKVGDEVYVKGEIMDVHEGIERPYFVAPNPHSINWVSEEKVFPVDKTYEMGLKDAWELAKKVVCSVVKGGFCCEEFEKIFGDIYTEDVFVKYTAEEALAKIEAYEFMQKIQEGDVVEASNGIKGVVVKILPGGGLNILHENGLFSAGCPDLKYKKTGKHFDIEFLLKEIGE